MANDAPGNINDNGKYNPRKRLTAEKRARYEQIRLRQLKVADGMARGKTQLTMAKELGVSQTTIFKDIQLNLKRQAKEDINTIGEKINIRISQLLKVINEAWSKFDITEDCEFLRVIVKCWVEISKLENLYPQNSNNQRGGNVINFQQNNYDYSRLSNSDILQLRRIQLLAMAQPSPNGSSGNGDGKQP